MRFEDILREIFVFNGGQLRCLRCEEGVLESGGFCDYHTCNSGVLELCSGPKVEYLLPM